MHGTLPQTALATKVTTLYLSRVTVVFGAGVTIYRCIGVDMRVVVVVVEVEVVVV
jgi:hypothetical protein